MHTLYPELFNKFEEIISEARTGEELFFTDSKQAAKDILKFMEREGMLKGKVVTMVIEQQVMVL